MKKDYLIFIAVIMLFHLQSLSQQVHIFREGLIATTGYRYGREAIYTDELAYRLYNKILKTPLAGDAFGNDDKGNPVTWRKIEADSLNRLRSGTRGAFGRGGSYIYLTYTSDKERAAILNMKGNSAVYVNGVPHMGDPYSSGFLALPIKLKKGLNEFFVRGGFIVAGLTFPAKAVAFNIDDPTLPTVVLGRQSGILKGAVVVINSSGKDLKGLQLKSVLQGKEVVSVLPTITAMSSRKVTFDFDAANVTVKGKVNCVLTLTDKGSVLDEANLPIETVGVTESYSATFISAIDNSLQYYAVTPRVGGDTGNAALFLSVHGAGVEAIGQARAYKSKDWGTLAAATNRRPRGFNWEDWGRLDALEVLKIAEEKFKPHPQKIYLTGHSMGGHGTWFLGATYPDKWAAIAPCAGYPTLKGYGSADGLVPDSSQNPIEQMLLRSSNQSDVVKLASNYKPLGVYIFHGDSDKVVSVNYARQMKKVLADFHSDMSYYEYPGGEHWFGDHSVDWKPIFDFFKWHERALDSSVSNIDFTTGSPGISPTFRWASILQQQHPLQYSNIKLQRSRAKNTVTGITTNVHLLKFNLSGFSVNSTVSIQLDKSAAIRFTVRSTNDSIFLIQENGQWTVGAVQPAQQKGPHRYGTFKDAFNHNMIFVYGTSGTKKENEWSVNKARYDAETWYYRGNGSVDIIADKEFSISKYKDRGVILFGNKNTNKAWDILLSDCPIQVQRNRITAGSKEWIGDSLSTYFVWPIAQSEIASVGVVSGTGLKGMNAANANQYFAGASGFPDFMIYGMDILRSGAAAVKMAGFFDHNWKLTEREFTQKME